MRGLPQSSAQPHQPPELALASPYHHVCGRSPQRLAVRCLAPADRPNPSNITRKARMFVRKCGFRRQCILAQGELVCAVAHTHPAGLKCTSTPARTIQPTVPQPRGGKLNPCTPRPHDDKPAFGMSYNLQQRLDAFVTGECSPDAFVHELFALCDATPDSAWDVLSLIDQYYRRGKLSADLFRTVRYRIERHVLRVRDSDTNREHSDAPMATETAVGAVRGVAVAMPKRAATPKKLASDVRALRIELLNARGTVQRYRRRLAILADFGHRTRSALANTQRELRVSRTQAIDYCERLRSGEWRRGVREQINGEFTGASATRDRMRIWRPVRSSQAVVLAVVLLGVGASPALQDSPRHWDVGNRALPPAAAVVIPQISDPGQISLSTDQYVVFPSHASAEIYVHRTGGASGDVSFVWWTEGSGARPGQDYVSGTPKIGHMLDGVDTLQLSIPILANPSRNHTELFYVAIGKPGGGASLGSIRRAAVIIMRPD
jgi:hypothetical protein